MNSVRISSDPALRAEVSWLVARGARYAILAALMLLLLLRVPFAATHVGLARDFFVAYRILHGEEFPLYGPILNGTIHLGPVWFYLLAGLLAIARSWLATLLLLGLLAALQIPLAYLLGKALHSRRAGLLFAVGLIVPNWATFEWLLPSHPLLSAPCDLALLVCAVRYWQRPRTRYFVGAAAMLALAIHAHPANAGMVWIVLALAAWAWHKRVLRLREVVLAAGVGVLPLLSFFYADATHDFTDLRHSFAYLGNAHATGSVFNLPQIFTGIVWGGTRDWFEPMLGWSPRWADLAAAIVAGGGVAGAFGLLLACRDPRRRRVVFVCALATLAVLLTTAAIRVDTPYYMASSGWTMLAGLVAYGLASLGESPVARVARGAVAAVAVVACVASIQGSAKFQMHGDWPFAWRPLFDIASPRDAETDSLALMPAYAQGRSGRFLCMQEAPSVHGTYAAQLMTDHAIAMRLACRRGGVRIGGSEPERQHWLGLPRALFAQIGIVPARHIGSLGLVQARPLGDLAGIVPPDEPVYPPQAPPPAPADKLHPLRIVLGAEQHLAITDLVYGMTAVPQVTVTIGGRPASQTAHDTFTTIYACDACAAGTQVDAVVVVGGNAYSAIDAVAF